MRPKKAKELIAELAEELVVSPDCAQDIIMFYWQEVRKNLSSLSHERIHITNLGDFTIKHWKIVDKIEMLERWEEQNRLKGMQEMTARFKIAENLYDLKNMQKLLQEETQRKEFITLHKKLGNEPKRKYNKNLEK